MGTVSTSKDMALSSRTPRKADADGGGGDVEGDGEAGQRSTLNMSTCSRQDKPASLQAIVVSCTSFSLVEMKVHTS